MDALSLLSCRRSACSLSHQNQQQSPALRQTTTNRHTQPQMVVTNDNIGGDDGFGDFSLAVAMWPQSRRRMGCHGVTHEPLPSLSQQINSSLLVW
jgi:hypothetical protein